LVCIPSHVTAVPPKAFSRRIAISALIPAFSLMTLFSA
jgi:hypothetical protein